MDDATASPAIGDGPVPRSMPRRAPRWLENLYRAKAWRVGIGVAVLVNSIVLGAITEVPKGAPIALRLAQIDNALLALLLVDVALCIAVKGRRVLRSGWDLFDITVTVVSISPNVGMMSAFRVLRVIRVLRLISFIPHGR